MKYWLFQNNQVAGPYDREELSQLQGFSPESLVCPEGRRGTEMGDWSRAGVVPELAESLLKTPRVATVARGGSLPPEPTLRDLAVLGTLQEKASLLENAVSQFQEDLRSRDLEISRLKVDFAQKERAMAEMQGKLAEMEASVVALTVVKKQAEDLSDKAAAQEAAIADLGQKLVEAKDELRQDIAKATDEERAAAARLEELHRRLETLQGELSRLEGEKLAAQGRLAEQERQLRELESRRPEALPPTIDVTPRPLFEAPIPAPQAPSASGPGRSGSALDPFPAVPPFPALKAEAPKLPETVIVPAVPEPSAAPAAAPPPAGLTTGFADLSVPTPAPVAAPEAQRLTPLSPVAAPKPEAPPMSPEAAGAEADLALSAKPKRKLPMAAIAGFLALGGTGGLYLMSGKLKAAKPTAPAPAAAPALPAPAPEPVDPSQTAVDFAKSYRLPDGQARGAWLEAACPSAGGLSPWLVEKTGDDNFEVRYYHSGPKKKTIVFEFTVRPKAAVLQGNNPTAVALLNGENPVPPPAPKARRRSRAKAPSGGGDVLIVPKEEAPAPKAAKAARPSKGAAGGPIETDQSLDELLLPGLEQPVKAKKKK